MATDPRTTGSTTPMSPLRKTALAAGLFYIATFVFSIPAQFGLFEGVLAHPAAFVLGAGSETSVLWGGLFDILTALTGIGTAVVLYPTIKRYGHVGALGFVTTRVLEASMIFVGVVSILSVVTLRQDLAGTDTSGLTTVARSLVAAKDWTFLLGPGFMSALNVLCLGSVMYRSRLVPRIIPTLGLIGFPLLFLSSAATVLGLHDQVSASAALLALPVALWELSLGVWMTVKGFTADTGGEDETPVVTRTPAFSDAAV